MIKENVGKQRKFIWKDIFVKMTRMSSFEKLQAISTYKDKGIV